tara:strand:+ start:1431 stop:2372 length:942 start_codon:yes stop_codon:yes gene_type:complete
MAHTLRHTQREARRLLRKSQREEKKEIRQAGRADRKLTKTAVKTIKLKNKTSRKADTESTRREKRADRRITNKASRIFKRQERQERRAIKKEDRQENRTERRALKAAQKVVRVLSRKNKNINTEKEVQNTLQELNAIKNPPVVEQEVTSVVETPVEVVPEVVPEVVSEKPKGGDMSIFKGKSYTQAYIDRPDIYKNMGEAEYIKEAKRQKKVYKETGKWDVKKSYPNTLPKIQKKSTQNIEVIPGGPNDIDGDGINDNIQGTTTYKKNKKSNFQPSSPYQTGIGGSGRMKKGGKRKMYDEGGFLEPRIETLFD